MLTFVVAAPSFFATPACLAQRIVTMKQMKMTIIWGSAVTVPHMVLSDLTIAVNATATCVRPVSRWICVPTVTLTVAGIVYERKAYPFISVKSAAHATASLCAAAIQAL